MQSVISLNTKASMSTGPKSGILSGCIGVDFGPTCPDGAYLVRVTDGKVTSISEGGKFAACVAFDDWTATNNLK